MNSLESVVRLQSVVAWVGIVSAVLAAVCGVLAYYLNSQASRLESRSVEEKLAAARTEAEEELGEEFQGAARRVDELEQRVRDLEGELEQARATTRSAQEAAQALQEEKQALQASLDRISGRLEQAREKAAQAEEQLERRRAAREAQGPITDRQREKFVRALKGKRGGKLDLVAVEGAEGAKPLAQAIKDMLEEAGWGQVTVRQAAFQGQPEGIYFLTHSQQSMPEYAAPLAIALTIIDLVSMPAKVRANPAKPEGYLGLIVGKPR